MAHFYGSIQAENRLFFEIYCNNEKSYIRVIFSSRSNCSIEELFSMSNRNKIVRVTVRIDFVLISFWLFGKQLKISFYVNLLHRKFKSATTYWIVTKELWVDSVQYLVNYELIKKRCLSKWNQCGEQGTSLKNSILKPLADEFPTFSCCLQRLDQAFLSLERFIIHVDEVRYNPREFSSGRDKWKLIQTKTKYLKGFQIRRNAFTNDGVALFVHC